MNSKEKASNLFMDFYTKIPAQTVRVTNISDLAKQCALIAVDEILKTNTFWSKDIASFKEETEEFWQEVKNEIEKL